MFAKNKRGYRLTAKNNRFRSLLILLLSVASIRRKLLKTTHAEERRDGKLFSHDHSFSVLTFLKGNVLVNLVEEDKP